MLYVKSVHQIVRWPFSPVIGGGVILGETTHVQIITLSIIRKMPELVRFKAESAFNVRQ